MPANHFDVWAASLFSIWGCSSVYVSLCVYKPQCVFMPGQIIGKCTQTQFLLLSLQTEYSLLLLLLFSCPSGPLLAPDSSANIVNLLGALTVGVSQKATRDVCAELLSFSTHVQSQRLPQLRRGQMQTSSKFSRPRLDLVHVFLAGSVLFMLRHSRGVQRFKGRSLWGKARLHVEPF